MSHICIFHCQQEQTNNTQTRRDTWRRISNVYYTGVMIVLRGTINICSTASTDKKNE
jgi:hypothetical protein